MRQRRTLLAILVVIPLLFALGVGLPALAGRGSEATLPASGTWTEDLFGTGELTRIDYSATMTGNEITLDVSAIETPTGVTYRVEDDRHEDGDKKNGNDDRNESDRSKNRGDEVEVEIEFLKCEPDDMHVEGVVAVIGEQR